MKKTPYGEAKDAWVNGDSAKRAKILRRLILTKQVMFSNFIGESERVIDVHSSGGVLMVRLPGRPNWHECNDPHFLTEEESKLAFPPQPVVKKSRGSR